MSRVPSKPDRAEWWDSETFEHVANLWHQHLSRVPQQQKAGALTGLAGAVGCKVPWDRCPGRVGLPASCDVQDFHVVTLAV